MKVAAIIIVSLACVALPALASDVVLNDIGVPLDCSLAAGVVQGGSVSGTLTVGGTIQIQVTNAPCPAGRTYLLIDNDGTDPIAGTFTNAPEGGFVVAGGQIFRITYTGGTGNDIVATALGTVPALGSVGLILLAASLATVALLMLRS
jgi:hypothetical protein